MAQVVAAAAHASHGGAAHAAVVHAHVPGREADAARVVEAAAALRAEDVDLPAAVGDVLAADGLLDDAVEVRAPRLALVEGRAEDHLGRRDGGAARRGRGRGRGRARRRRLVGEVGLDPARVVRRELHEVVLLREALGRQAVRVEDELQLLDGQRLPVHLVWFCFLLGPVVLRRRLRRDLGRRGRRRLRVRRRLRGRRRSRRGGRLGEVPARLARGPAVVVRRAVARVHELGPAGGQRLRRRPDARALVGQVPQLALLDDGRVRRDVALAEELLQVLDGHGADALEQVIVVARGRLRIVPRDVHESGHRSSVVAFGQPRRGCTWGCPSAQRTTSRGSSPDATHGPFTPTGGVSRRGRPSPGAARPWRTARRRRGGGRR